MAESVVSRGAPSQADFNTDPSPETKNKLTVDLGFNPLFKSTYEKLNQAWLAGDANIIEQLEDAFEAQSFPFDYSTIESVYRIQLTREKSLATLRINVPFIYRAPVFGNPDPQQQTSSQATGGKDTQLNKSEELRELWCFVKIIILRALIELHRGDNTLQLKPKDIIRGIVWLAHIQHKEADTLAAGAADYLFMLDELGKHPGLKERLKEIDTQQVAHEV